MFSTARKTVNRNITFNIAKTLLFTTSTTLIIFYLLLKKNDPEDLLSVFIMSFVSISFSYAFAKIAVNTIKEQSRNFQHSLQVSILLIGCIIGSTINCLFHYIIENDYNLPIQKNVFLYSFIIGGVFHAGLYYFFYSKRKLDDSKRKIQEEKIRRLTLEKETTLTTLKLLQAQIEPHFLFNTLSNIISLFDIDAQKAKKMLLDLNEYLRTALQISRQDMTTLEQELSLIRRYLDIFKVRMGRRLSYEIEQSGDCSQIKFPPMIIQPLVENAIKYGIEPKKEGGCICVKCETEQNHLKITVTDTGIGLDKMNDTVGVGLNNITSRLDSIYGNRALFTLIENKPSGVKAIIEVML